MPKPDWLRFDTKCDRTELLRLLAHLPPAERVAWVAWCCQQAALPRSGVRPGVSRETYAIARAARWDDAQDERLTILLVMDLAYLCMSYHLDLSDALLDLEQRGRRYRRDAKPSSASRPISS